ncbi:MAG: hypothetical protein LBU75_14540 [Desulfovibrio sp.]|jgi:hypothetical protein|nr:hypothetical protein [Desulfovibrio sp.]
MNKQNDSTPQPSAAPRTLGLPMKEIEQELRSLIQAAKAEGLEGIGRIEIAVEPQVLYGIKISVFPND